MDLEKSVVMVHTVVVLGERESKNKEDKFEGCVKVEQPVYRFCIDSDVAQTTQWFKMVQNGLCSCLVWHYYVLNLAFEQ